MYHDLFGEILETVEKAQETAEETLDRSNILRYQISRRKEIRKG